MGFWGEVAAGPVPLQELGFAVCFQLLFTAEPEHFCCCFQLILKLLFAVVLEVA